MDRDSRLPVSSLQILHEGILAQPKARHVVGQAGVQAGMLIWQLTVHRLLLHARQPQIVAQQLLVHVLLWKIQAQIGIPRSSFPCSNDHNYKKAVMRQLLSM